MKRDELLRTMRRVEHVQDRDGIQWCPSCGQNKEANEPHDLPCEMASAIAWLERLPAGCELVGLLARDGDTFRTPFIAIDVEVARGKWYEIPTRYMNPDDLTKAGSTSRRCPRHGAYERVCQECLDEQRGKR